MTHASSMGSSSTILGDLVSTVPPMLYGLSVRGAGVCFSLPRTGVPPSDIFPTDATHFSPLTFWRFLLSSFFICYLILLLCRCLFLLFKLRTLLRSEHKIISWNLLVRKAYCLFLYWLCLLFLFLYKYIYALDMICDVYLMQSEYIHDSQEWERERASLKARIQ